MKVSTEAKIGIIVLLTIALVIWGINYLKGRNVIKRSDVYYAVYNDVAGLKKSGSVTLSGFKVGMINSIEFMDGRLDKVVVSFIVDNDFELPKNSVAQIFSTDVMGNKVIRIIPSDEKEFYHIGDTLPSSIDLDILTKVQNQITPLIESSTKTISGIDTLVSSINRVLDPATQMKLQSALVNLESATTSISRQLSPGGKLDKTFSSLQAFTQMLDNNKEKLASAFSNIENITDTIASAHLAQAIANINSTFQQSQILLEKINKGEGSFGLMATSDSLYTNLKSASENLSVLIEDINKNPKRYVHFSLFGKKDKRK
jgi:phospholipid/cholesterol/gamma-HCH transport system substrate-binding protein